MRLHYPSVVVAALVVLAFLAIAPAPKGCGCADRKRRLEELGGRVFNG